MNRKLIAVTMGDAAGIGPEIVLKTFANASFIDGHPSFVIGDVGVLRAQTAIVAATAGSNIGIIAGSPWPPKTTYM